MQKILYISGAVGLGHITRDLAIARQLRRRDPDLDITWRKLRDAPGFYAVIFISMAIGFAINLFGINPVLALYYSAVLNGVIAPPLLVVIMLIGSNPRIMKDKVNGRVSNILGWATAILMSVSAAGLLWSFWFV